MTERLKEKTLRALAWNSAGTLGNRIVQFVVTVVLARLLTPAEFGLIAVLTIFTMLAAALIESGFGSALIQMQTVTREDESAVFYFNLIMAAGLYGVLWFLAGPIAWFYQQPALVPLTRVLALIFFFNAFGLVQGCLLTKQLNFHAQTQALVLATIFSGAVGIVMALLGCGVWSLAAQSLANTAVRSGLLWVYSPWRPLRRIGLGPLRNMFPYGSRLLASSVLGVIFENSYAAIIGRFFSKADVGFYMRAQLTQRLAADSLTGTVINVAFPAYASVQGDPAQLRAGYRRSIIYTSVLIFPLMLGLAAIARPLFLLLFSAKWAASIPYFRILCLSGMLYHLQALNLNVLKATGRSDLYFRLALAKVGLALVWIAAALPFGMLGIVWGQVIAAWLGLGINTFYAGRIIQYPLREQFRDVLPYALVGGASAAVAFAASPGLAGWPLVAQVGVLTLQHAALYLLLTRLFRLEGPQALFRIAQPYLSRLRPGRV